MTCKCLHTCEHMRVRGAHGNTRPGTRGVDHCPSTSELSSLCLANGAIGKVWFWLPLRLEEVVCPYHQCVNHGVGR